MISRIILVPESIATLTLFTTPDANVASTVSLVSHTPNQSNHASFAFLAVLEVTYRIFSFYFPFTNPSFLNIIVLSVYIRA